MVLDDDTDWDAVAELVTEATGSSLLRSCRDGWIYNVTHSAPQAQAPRHPGAAPGIASLVTPMRPAAFRRELGALGGGQHCATVPMRARSRPLRAARHTIQRRAGAIVGKVRLGSMLPVRQSAARGSALLVAALLCSACTEQQAEPVGIPSVETTVRGYSLLTHCGIHEVEIGGRFYRVAPPLDDGAATRRPDGTTQSSKAP